MNRTEAFQILGIGATKEDKAIKSAYREKLAAANPEDDPDGFKRLRRAYEEACRYAREPEDAAEETPRDITPSGLWVERAARIYGDIRSRQDLSLWRELFRDDTFLSLEEEENCRIKLVGFLTEHFRLPTEIWRLLDEKLSIVKNAKALRERFPAHFVYYIVGKCQRGEDVEFSQFRGAEDADYDLFLQYYDRCWNAMQEKNYEEAGRYLEEADSLDIWHPVMEICRAGLYVNQRRTEEAFALLEKLRADYPKDALIGYNTAEIFWREGDRDQAARIYCGLKEELPTHYMANVRLTEWYYDKQQYREAKKCAEKVLASGSDDAFMQLLGKINANIEKELEAAYRRDGAWEPALELCWCYLQDGRISRGIRLALELEGRLPQEREAEYSGLLAKLYVEQAQYEESIAMTRFWEESLKRKMEREAGTQESEEEKDRDRLRQAHLIRMQCYHNLGYRDKENFALAVREGESILTGDVKDVGVLLEIAQLCMEMGEYERSLETADRLVEEYQIFAAYASSLEVYRRQLNAAGVIRMAGHCIRYFPTFVKSYEYLAKVYLDLDYREELEKVLEDARKNGAGSVILDAYEFQMTHETMEVGALNSKLREFRNNFLKFAEDGESGFYEKGLPILTEYLYHYPDDFMLVERAIFHRAAHHYQEAREDFEKALYINPSNPYALNGLSFVHKYQGEYERALFYIKKAILYMDKDMSPIIYADMGSIYSLLGDYERALEAFRQYEHATKNNRSNWFGNNLAEYHMRAGRIREAAEIYESFYVKNECMRFEKLAELYGVTGQEEKARQSLVRWKRALRKQRGLQGGLLFGGGASVRPKCQEVSFLSYYHSLGWTELLCGERGAAIGAFGKMMRSGFLENTMEGKLRDAVFACILCGDERRGRKYSGMLSDWLRREKASGGNKYYNREKAHVWMEFLAGYYTEPAERLRELLEKGDCAGICHSCVCPLCKELEGARVLLLLRTGQREEAAETLRRNLEIQPWDEYMLAVKHIVFRDML